MQPMLCIFRPAILVALEGLHAPIVVYVRIRCWPLLPQLYPGPIHRLGLSVAALMECEVLVRRLLLASTTIKGFPVLVAALFFSMLWRSACRKARRKEKRHKSFPCQQPDSPTRFGVASARRSGLYRCNPHTPTVIAAKRHCHFNWLSAWQVPANGRA
ncbi:hypothetical protein LY76DRAFT_147790 [Colletotrichum caudatum]|nr:hypothetical protein LY76DRAFT_147790 [Colletotrichum caudatum]